MSIDEEGEPSAEDENAEAGQPPEPKTDTLAVKRINLESASMPLESKVQLKVTAVDMAKEEASPLGAQKHLNQVRVFSLLPFGIEIERVVERHPGCEVQVIMLEKVLETYRVPPLTGETFAAPPSTLTSVRKEKEERVPAT